MTSKTLLALLFCTAISACAPTAPELKPEERRQRLVSSAASLHATRAAWLQTMPRKKLTTMTVDAR
ncbi:MAG: hypothetical protein EOP85_13695, partial [Verrucomicrobiaceae bacterium]